MLELDEFEDQPSGTVFRDVLMLTLIGFVAMVIMLLPHLSAKRDENRDAAAPGNVVVEIHWPNELPVDVDLWVQAPGDVPVGFWNQGSRYRHVAPWSLARLHLTLPAARRRMCRPGVETPRIE